MSRQDNFFLLLVKVCSISWLYVYSYVGMKWALSFSFIVAVLWCFSSLWILSFFWWDFLFFCFICRRCFVCIYLFITLVSGLFIWGVLGPWGFLWRAGSCFPSAWGSAVWSVGPVLFIWVLAGGGWRGCTGFFSLGLCCGGYGTIYLSAGRGCGPFVFAVFSLLSALSAGGCLW